MKKLLCVLGVISLTGCSGITHNEEVYTAHAESFNIVGFQVPGNTQDRAMELVPEGATVETIRATNSDTSSVLGIVNRIIGIDYVQVGGKKIVIRLSHKLLSDRLCLSNYIAKVGEIYTIIK